MTAPDAAAQAVDSVRAAVRWAAARLRAAGVESPELDARLLVQHALGLSREALLTEPRRPLSEAERARIDALVGRRVAREPVSRILGRREFWSLEFTLSPATLDPRPDSETVVEAVLEALPDRSAPVRLLDLGTGTGCLLLALLSELPQAQGVGIDCDPEAVATACANAERLGLAGRARFVQADWRHPEALLARTGDDFDGVVANPPYIPESDIDGLAPEVSRFDPRLALAGGGDGLEAYRRLAPLAARLVRPGGVVAFEVGAGQAAAVMDLLARSGLAVLPPRRDLAGVERCIRARRAPGIRGGP